MKINKKFYKNYTFYIGLVMLSIAVGSIFFDKGYFLFTIIDIFFAYLGIKYVYQSLVVTKRCKRSR
ncbi:hypothetical protein [Ligilactobacillus salivarius]|uniref:hypothetical protein n=1 Tax=Ligilactobacillus salivarius TaxID=1624 RepID=UPI000B359817|nr:hypothetical protein [Ligilactobacillus salivarius]MDE1500208.1 hypothetical protein [Ligilactobacillus salivarius]MDE1506993.1 hypothetical protein [Ligilactobacillus salivarius]MDE1521960.1 hypothetical protein [Ligilactobacillus salivarius]MDE1542775.1 hypothetical protein [Ligilactobacillus salivarius]